MSRRQLMLRTVGGLSSLLFTACGVEEQPTVTTPPTPPPLPASTTAQPPTVPATTFIGVSQTTATTASPTTPPATTITETPTTTTTPATTPPEAGLIRISIHVHNGVVESADGHLVVPRGTEIELTVTADVSDEVHVHSYDFKANVTPTDAAVIQFVADVPGIFEVELEDARLVLLKLEVR
jgi:hypothetical protein